ncbi:RNA-binding protein [Salmonella enterica]|nr:DUF3850 domain-containing protein [Salmonella enterica]EBJ1501915.1 RNA-binding protein [Salmonella enterica]EGX5005980.1 RNA-binding protein [Salmonella enterica]
MMHNLKILPEHFIPVIDGKKLAELRFNDRDFKAGDYLHLQEFHSGSYTGECCIAEVIHVADVGAYLEGYVLISINIVR